MTDPTVRKAIVALSVVLVPLTIYHSTSILTALMNGSIVPFGHVRHASIAYGNEPSHRLDVYVPHGAERAPVVIFWHGGLWMRGSKEDVRFVGAALARLGYVTVIPNYRHYPQVRFPAFVDDGARAVAWVRQEIARFDGDANTIFLMGHSAGAYIATMLAFDDRFLLQHGESARCIRGVIGMSGPYTMQRPAVFLDAIFDQASDIGWRPVDAVSAAAPPTLLLHGQADDIVWVDEAQALADRLEARAVPTELRTYPDRSHHDLLIAWWWPLRFRAPVREDVRRFIDRQSADKASRPACNRRVRLTGLTPARRAPALRGPVSFSAIASTAR